jgi:predicted HicB family RNase H-like nuclease
MTFDYVRATTPSKEFVMVNEQETSKATIYVRIPSQLHRRARVQALNEGINMARLVEAALVQYLVETEQEVSP